MLFPYRIDTTTRHSYQTFSLSVFPNFGKVFEREPGKFATCVPHFVRISEAWSQPAFICKNQAFFTFYHDLHFWPPLYPYPHYLHYSNPYTSYNITVFFPHIWCKKLASIKLLGTRSALYTRWFLTYMLWWCMGEGKKNSLCVGPFLPPELAEEIISLVPSVLVYIGWNL